MNSEPLKDLLGRLKPKDAGLDRDALLFEAGRASVEPSRLWKALAGALATTQAATLLFLLPALPVADRSPAASAIASRQVPRDPSDKWVLSGRHPSALPGPFLPRDGELPPLPAGEALLVSTSVMTVFGAESGLRGSSAPPSPLFD